MLAPVVLGPNYVPQAYPAGGLSAAFRGIDPDEATSPEDWVASATERWGDAPNGLSRLPDGSLLRDALEKDPVGYLGERHVEAFGSDPGLLVKLLDASERLVVHCHPDRDFASKHLGCAHGKTEAWIVLDARPGATVWAAFRRDVTRDELDDWVAEQRVEEMLDALHPIEVEAGSAVLVPAGLPHAIGDGILVLELQEPTDFSVMLERGHFSGGDLGLGFDVALGSVDRTGWSPERVARLSGPGTGRPGPVLPAEASPFFRAELVASGSGAEIEGFAVLVVTGGSGSLVGAFPGSPLPVSAGTTVLLPHGAGPVRVLGATELVVCRPPDAAAPGVARPNI